MSLIEMWGLSNHQDVVQKTMIDLGYADSHTSSTHPNQSRRSNVARRLRLYHNRERVDHEYRIDTIFTDPKVQEQRKRLLPIAMYQNVTARIVDEVASLYDRPAVRQYGGGSAEFDDVLNKSRWPLLARRAQRLLFLCNHLLLWYCKTKNDTAKIRVVTPDMFSAIGDVEDPSTMAAVVIDRKPSLSDTPNGFQEIVRELWDDTYRYLLTASHVIVRVEEHGLGRIPGVLAHYEEPSGGGLLDLNSGSDIESAHLAVVWLNVLILRLSKSQGERQPILIGDSNANAFTQSMDGESPLLLSTGSVVEMLDSVTPADHYLAVKRDTITAVAQTYGMSYDALSYTDDMSGRAYNARRQKLKEIRDQQRVRALEHERQICELLGFNPSKLTVDFTEQTIPLDAIEEVALLEQKIKIGADSVVNFLLRKDPDLTREGAASLIVANIEDQKIGLVVESADGGEAAVTLLNGAQVTALLEVVQTATAGKISRDAAIAIVTSSFGVPEETASKMVGVVGFVPRADPVL